MGGPRGGANVARWAAGLESGRGGWCRAHGPVKNDSLVGGGGWGVSELGPRMGQVSCTGRVEADGGVLFVQGRERGEPSRLEDRRGGFFLFFLDGRGGCPCPTRTMIEGHTCERVGGRGEGMGGGRERVYVPWRG